MSAPDNNQNNPSLKHALLYAALISVLALACSYFVSGELTTLEAFIPQDKASDFSFSDFYSIAGDNAQSLPTDSVITIVALDGCNRAAIGRAIAAADSCGASVIGLDLLFDPPTIDHDSVILAVDTARCIVLPTILSDYQDDVFWENEKSYFEPQLVNPHLHGAVNINGQLDNSTTRYFKTEFPTIDQTPVPSFGLVIAEAYRPGITAKIVARDNDMELIRYHNKVFNILLPEEVTSYPELIRNKIVLMGFVRDFSDFHHTPLANDVPGTIIHAHIISTIVNDELITESPAWLAYAVAYMACLIIVAAGLYLRNKDWGAMTVRFIQVGLMLLVLYCGSVLYVKHDYSFDFTPTIVITVLGLVIMDICIGINSVLAKGWNFIVKYSNKLINKFKK